MKKISLLLFLVLLFASCKQIEYIEVPKVVTEVKTNTIHDSVDRWRTHYEFIKGDTVYSIDTLYRATYHFQTDTFVRVDSIPVVDTSALFAAQRQISELKSENRQQIIYILILLVGIIAICVALYFRDHAKSNR